MGGWFEVTGWMSCEVSGRVRTARRSLAWRTSCSISRLWRGLVEAVIVSGEGCYVTDERGNRYIDGLAGLFTTQVGMAGRS